MFVRARLVCPRRGGFTVLAAVCVLAAWLASATTAHAQTPLTAVQQVAAPVVTTVEQTATEVAAPVREAAPARRTAVVVRSAPQRTGAVVPTAAPVVRAATQRVARPVAAVKAAADRTAAVLKTAAKAPLDAVERAVPARAEAAAPRPDVKPLAAAQAADRIGPRLDRAAAGRVAGTVADGEPPTSAGLVAAAPRSAADAPTGWRNGDAGGPARSHGEPAGMPSVPDSQPGTASVAVASSAGAAAAAIFGLLALLLLAAPQLSSAVRLRPAFAPLAPFRALSERPG